MLFPLCALAQSPAAGVPAPATAPAAAPTDTPSDATAAVPAEAAAPPEPVALESCRSLTDKAMAADLRALTAQAEKQEGTALLPLHAAAQALWSQAIERCEGRAKDRAQRNLAESQKASAVLNEQLGDGPECTAAHKDAATLQNLARTALGERRWNDAATLFHKSEDMWDVASERCTGSQKELAIKRQEQSEIDGFNAEFCAPQFDRAREQTQKLRASAAGMTREDKQDGLMVAETLWREALAQCKGAAAQDSARNNAQALARERGTPWVARSPAVAAAAVPLNKPATAAAASTPAKAVAQAAAPVGSTALAAAASTTSTASTAAASTASSTSSLGATLSGAFASVTAAVQQAAAPAKPQAQPEDFAVGDMHFKGQFVRDVDTPTYTGSGKLTWANGDVFEGSLLNGKRHGKGRFAWANGHRYQGDWVNDVATGQAVVDFANGNHFEGAVENGVPKGTGSMAYASGDRYTGRFIAGEPHGNGSYTWKNGQKFEGDWKAGKPEGQGTLLFANGDRYEGQVTGGVPHQTGTFTWASGDRYAGQWKAGAKHGQGTFTWTSGDRWEGLYEADVQTSSGTLIRKNP
ncbi:hypothetical protein DIC66_09785 [Rhodoferax lacus]|uniref:MORN repeat-containing protein n=1 Tax=Rhodoferax lacus TaxID=2184758 RepID=A0A3E1RDG1_9BURK|nr:hypothetical protein DIC66_09785 [Rhodoferax lacus]